MKEGKKANRNKDKQDTKAVAYHELTINQSLSNSSPSLNCPPVSLPTVMVWSRECPLVQMGSAVPAVLSPSTLCTPSLLAVGKSEKERKHCTGC